VDGFEAELGSVPLEGPDRDDCLQGLADRGLVWRLADHDPATTVADLCELGGSLHGLFRPAT
jgi:hypothetical protein